MAFNLLDRIDGSYGNADLQLAPHGVKDGGETVHAGVAALRQHPVKALRGHRRLLCPPLEPDRGIDQIPKDQPRRFRLAIQEQRGRLVKQCLRELRIPRNARDPSL